MEGWKCPVCNKGVNPNEKMCDHGTMPWEIPYWPSTTSDGTRPLRETTPFSIYMSGDDPNAFVTN